MLSPCPDQIPVSSVLRTNPLCARPLPGNTHLVFSLNDTDPSGPVVMIEDMKSVQEPGCVLENRS